VVRTGASTAVPLSILSFQNVIYHILEDALRPSWEWIIPVELRELVSVRAHDVRADLLHRSGCLHQQKAHGKALWILETLSQASIQDFPLSVEEFRTYAIHRGTSYCQ